MTITTKPRTVERTVHPARKVAGVALATAGATTAVVVVVIGAAGLLVGAPLALALTGYAVSHRWTRLPARRTRLASEEERDGSADYARRVA